MDERIGSRFDDLVSRGSELVGRLPRDWSGVTYYVSQDDMPEYQRWLQSASSLLDVVTLPDSSLRTERDRLLAHEHMQYGLPCLVVAGMYGLVQSASDEWKSGLLRKVEYLVAAATFDDFLDHAADYHKGNKKIEASVLASAVLEDTVKKIAAKHELQSDGKALEDLINDLVKAGVLTQVKAKRIKAASAVRNHALHAEWEKLDIRDVGVLIDTVRALIDEFL